MEYSKVEEQSMKEEIKVLGWGKSLPVPSVQEIVKKNPESVPKKYVQDHENRPLNSELCIDSSEIPILDFSLLVDGDRDEAEKLDLACKEWGFFQLINHGVSEEILCDVKSSVAAFFALPSDEKKKYSMAENDLQGYGQAYVVSEEQKLDWCDIIFLMTSPNEARNLKYWPKTIPGFMEAIEKYSKEIERVSEEILSNLSLLMGMDKNGVKELHQMAKQSMRMNYYPACSRPELVLGVSPHSDGGSLTVLLQDDDITALQIKHDDRWIAVKPIKSSLVVNVGDVIEVWSNGKYKSIEHRAVTNANKERISVATFVMPHENIQIGPIETMLNDRPPMYININYYDYIKHVLENKMDGKSHTNFLKLENWC